VKKDKEIKVRVEMSPDASKRYTEACLKVLRRREAGILSQPLPGKAKASETLSSAERNL